MKKQYSDLIFNKIKMLEFRNKIPSHLKENDRVYIYETKSQGCGMVVGYFIVDKINKIKHSKLGTYIYMDFYANLFCDDNIKHLIKKAKSINLINCYNDLVCDYCLMENYLDEMLETNRPPDIDFLHMNPIEFKKYEMKKNQQKKFLNDCDDWLRKIGFFNEFDESYWEYEIRIKDAIKFTETIPITNFKLNNGHYLKVAPQSFCYTITMI